LISLLDSTSGRVLDCSG